VGEVICKVVDAGVDGVDFGGDGPVGVGGARLPSAGGAFAHAEDVCQVGTGEAVGGAGGGDFAAGHRGVFDGLGVHHALQNVKVPPGGAGATSAVILLRGDRQTPAPGGRRGRRSRSRH